MMPDFIHKIATRLYGNAYLLLTLTCLFWAGNFIVGRGIHGEIPPIALAWIRWCGAFLIILPFAYKHVRHDWPVIKKNWLILVALGAPGIGAFNTLVYTGLNYTTAINALIINSISPVFMAILAFLLFRERLSLLQAIGVIISVGGVFVVVCRGDVATLADITFNKGDLYVLGAFFIWALYTVLLKLRPEIHWLSFLAATFLFAALANTPFLFWEINSGRVAHFSVNSISALAYVMIFPSLVAYLCYNRGVQLIGPNRAGAFLHFVPLFGTVLAVLALGETLEAFHIAGFVLIIAGVVMTTKKSRKEKK